MTNPEGEVPPVDNPHIRIVNGREYTVTNLDENPAPPSFKSVLTRAEKGPGAPWTEAGAKAAADARARAKQLEAASHNDYAQAPDVDDDPDNPDPYEAEEWPAVRSAMHVI